jgi:hypothetical protein
MALTQPDHSYHVASYADPATAAFVVIPLLLMAVLMWARLSPGSEASVRRQLQPLPSAQRLPCGWR